MKRIALTIIIVIQILFAYAQQEAVNNLKYKLSVTVIDSVKAITLDSLSMNYLFFTTKPDSSFYYANEFINYAFNLKDKKYLILAYARMGFYYLNTSQYKAGLDISLKGIRISEEYHIYDYLSALYYNISWVYFNLGDPVSGLKNAFAGIPYLKDNRDGFLDQPLHIFGLIGNIYLNNDKRDSAFYYFKLVDSLASISKELAAKDISAWYWGMYYLNTGIYQKADSILSAGIASCEKNGDFLLDVFHLFLAESYLDQRKINEAIAEAGRALDIAISINDKGDAQSSASLLNTCYDRLGNFDSAYHYLKVSDSLNAVVLNNGSANEIQQIRFDQEITKKEEESARILQNEKNRNRITLYVFFTALIFFLIIAGIQWRNNKQRKKANTLLQHQKEKVESTLLELRSTQAQLIQSEKMASLGELTAGIAHEIQNPLNFINNFSEVNKELLEEMKDKIKNGNIEEVNVIADTVIGNEEKISHHGSRADAIVKGMLQHSRKSTGHKEPTDINALADEYLRLSYHGLRAKDKSFNAILQTDFDKNIGTINIIAQDIGRVLLNLFNNAFYAVNEKKKNPRPLTGGEEYQPAVTVSTKAVKSPSGDSGVILTVKDNGNGIPQNIADKIFQPFFTTKPTGEGTGLGLSLSYDIIKAHGANIQVKTSEGEGAEFIIQFI